MNRTFSILLYLKNSKALENKTVPIYMRLTIDGKRSEISTKRYIDPEKWNVDAQKLNGKTEDIKTINDYLKTLERKVSDAHKSLMDNHDIITSETLKNKVLGVEEKQMMLMPVIEQHNKDLYFLIGNGYSLATWTKYQTTKSHITNFIKWKFKVSDLPLKSLAYQTIADFEFYLKAEKKIGQNAASKYVTNFKKIILEAVSKKMLSSNPFEFFQAKVLPTTPVFLFDYELAAIERKIFTIERLAQVRDLFVFCCYTGLAYVDVLNLTPHDIAIGIDGEKWIFTNRQKSDVASNIPLLPQAISIIEKYKAHPKVIQSGKVLPMSSNQKMNSYLKEIADLCRIDKNLTWHVSRHTFATTVLLSNDVPIESASKMLGHTKLKSTQHYAKVLNQKVSRDMAVLKNKFMAKLEVVQPIKAIS